MSRNDNPPGRLATEFDDAIDWNRPAADVAAWIGGRPTERPGFSFIGGFRLSVFEARPLDAAPPGNAGALCVDNEMPAVTTATGAVALVRCALNIAGDLCDDLATFLQVCPLPGPIMLSRRPFLDNAAINLWEQHVERWRWRRRGLTDLQGPRRPSHGGSTAPGAPHLSSANRPFFEWLLSRFGLGPGARVIDVGCGEGWAARGFRDLGLQVVGVDLLESAISAARRLTPDGEFFVCDVFDLSSRHDLEGAFDLVFCRDMGIAQKIVDWSEPRWIEVGRALLDLLTPDGIVYWIQMTDCSGTLGIDGFTNATVDTMRDWFGRHGELVSVNRFGFLSLVACRREAAASRAARLRLHDAGVVRSVVETHWDGVEAAASLADPVVREVTRALYLKMSPFLLLPEEARNRGIVIAGTGRMAQLCAEVARDVGLPVLAFGDAGGRRGLLMDHLVLPMAEVLALKPAGVILTERDQEPPPNVRCVAVYDGVPATPAPAVFLISADQDAYFEGVKSEEARLRAWATPLLGLTDVLRNGSFEAWGSSGLREWTFGGAPRTTAVCVPSDLRSGQRAVEITCGPATTYVVQRHTLRASHFGASFGCWIWSEVPGVARLQLSTAQGDVASATHPGDGRWHFLVVRRDLKGTGYLDAYLQLLGPGHARFDEAVLLLY